MNFRHIKFFTVKGGLTIAYKVEENTLRMSIAFCSPKEKAFTKKTGREVAIAKFAQNAISVTFDPSLVSPIRFIDIFYFELIDKYLKVNDLHINWIKRLLK